MVQASARNYDDEAPRAIYPTVSMQAARTKMFTNETVGRVADGGVRIHGAAGTINDDKFERFYRDVRLLRLVEGRIQVQQLAIRRHLMREA